MNRQFLLVLFCFAFACVNDPQNIPPTLYTNPVFYAELSVGQEMFRLAAGDNGYSMKTVHFNDDEGVTHYIATLSSETCSQGACPALEIEFFDHQHISGPQSGVDFTFQPGIKEYYNAAQDGALDLTFFLGPDGSGSGVSFWTTSEDTIPLTTNELQLMAQPDEFVDLCFHRFANGDCQGYTSYCFHTLASSPFIGVLKADRSLGDYVVIEMDLQGEPPYSYMWMNGATTPFILVPVEDGEEFGVGVTVTDKNQSRVEISQTISMHDGIAEMCGGSPQFVWTLSPVPFSQYSTVIIRYTDSTGKEYSSAYGPQQAESFEIVNVMDFDDSPDGYATKQLELMMTCKLYTADGTDSLDLSSTDAVAAISYDR